MPTNPNSLADFLWRDWLEPAWLQQDSPDSDSVDPGSLANPALALALSQRISLPADRVLAFLAWLSRRAVSASESLSRPVFWLHLQACWLGRVLAEADDQTYLAWLQTQPRPEAAEHQARPLLLPWLAPPVLRAAARGQLEHELLPGWLPGDDLSPRVLDSCYTAVLDQLFPYRQQVADRFDATWLAHIMAWLQPASASADWALRLQATPLLVFALRRAGQAESLMRALGSTLFDTAFWEGIRPLAWAEGYHALAAWLAELCELQDLQTIRDELFRELAGARARPEARITFKLRDRLSDPQLRRSVHLISLHAFIRTDDAQTEQLSYLPVQSVWNEAEGRPSANIRPGRQNLPYLMVEAGHWHQAWEIGKKYQARPEYRLRERWERGLKAYSRQAESLDAEMFQRMRSQQVFEIVCLPHMDFYFAWSLLVLLHLRAEPSSRRQAFFAAGLDSPLSLPEFSGPGPASWAELMLQCGLEQGSESRRGELLDSLHRLSCQKRLALSQGAAPGWHLLGEFALLFCRLLSEGLGIDEALLAGAGQIAEATLPDSLLAAYWDQIPGLRRPAEMPEPNQLDSGTFLTLSPFPLLLAEMHQHLGQPGSGTFFFVALGQERLEQNGEDAMLVPAAFLTGNLKQLSSGPAWPFVNIRHRELIARITEFNRMYLDTISIAQRKADQERLHQLQSEQRELASEHARVAHLQGIDEELRTMMSGIRQLRQQAIQLQNRVYPGSYGMLSLREDLDWLFEHERTYDFSLSWQSDELQLAGASELERARALLGLRERYGLHPQVTALRQVSIQPAGSGSRVKGYRFRTMHSDHNPAHFSKAWPEYLPILYSQALYLNLPWLLSLIHQSHALDGRLLREDLPHEQKLFRLLKSLAHRSHNPLRYGKGRERRNLLQLAQLLGLLLDAWGLDERYALQIEYQLDQQSPQSFRSIADLLLICEPIEAGDADAGPALRSRRAVPLPAGIKPVDLLTPLHQLISHELRPAGEAGRCTLNRLCLHNHPGGWTLRLACDGHLEDEALRESTEGLSSGLSSCLHKLAAALQSPLPKPVDADAEAPLEGALWIRRYTLTETRRQGFQQQVRQVPYTEIGLRLESLEA